ncbi:MAG: AAA family ATPase, partial [Chloroflexi bacterium]|nr:AAA family ATPase [Chloroflexota bacterium]
MEQESLFERVRSLQRQGQDAASIAAALGVPVELVERAAISDGPTARLHWSAERGAFIGRQLELDGLRAALDAARAGRGKLVMLAGEPGIGKTRIAQELSAIAERSGARALWGRCYEGQGAPPYWPWAQIIRAYARECDAERLRQEMGVGAADIAEIVPDAREWLGDIAPSPRFESQVAGLSNSSEQARFRLFDSVAVFLKSASRSQPLVLVLDNLHGADKSSLLLLEFLMHELADSRLLALGTYRSTELSRQHPLSETLAELASGLGTGVYQRLQLRGLSLGDVSEFIHAVAGMRPPLGVVGAIHSQTEGNPLFIQEVVRLLVQEGALAPERLGKGRALSISVPEGVREVIGRRLNRLSESCAQTLSVASVIGREFGLNELERLVDHLSEDRLLEVIEEAVAARIIEDVPQSAERYQFTHVLIRETLYDELTGARRARLHRRIGEAMEELYAADLEPHLAQLAHHFFEAASTGLGDKAVEYATRAA